MPRPVFPPGRLGTGWGGPAKGSGNGSPRYQDFRGERFPGSALDSNSDPDEQRYRQERKAYKRELRERMMKVLIDNAEDESNIAPARILAANAVLDRIDGKPVPATQQIVSDDVSSLSDEELAAEIRRLERTIVDSAVPNDQKLLPATQAVDP